MNGTKFNPIKLLDLTSELLKLKDEIAKEIAKQSDIHKRKKYNEAIEKAFADPSLDNIIAFRKLLFEV